jgi:pimeloyl-ACP methyl ester carboxylesterase
MAVLDEVLHERVQTASRAFGVRRHRITFRNPGGPLAAEVETEENGALVRVVLPAAQVHVARDDVASVAARQQRFFREGDEDVRIPASGFSLAATISRPRTLPPPPRGRKVTPLPAIVLVPGSGPMDRDAIVAGVPIFGELAAGLADAGFLVVRYDKRGVGQSGGREEAATLADYAEDVLATLRWLRNRDDVDERALTVIGHSEGGWVALTAASRERRIARVGLLATPGTTGAALVLEQQAAALAKATLSEEERLERVALQQTIHAALLEGGSWDGVPDDLRRQAESPWFASFLAFDPAEVMRKVRQPIFILAGALDRQVAPHHAEALATMARARKDGGEVTMVVVPGVNHLLAPATTGEVDEYATLTERHVSEAVVSALVEWVRGVRAAMRQVSPSPAGPAS